MAAAGTEQTSGKPRVLVVDDSRVVRHSISKILHGEFHVLQANDGVHGWETAEQQGPDLVISDINMPNLDGYGMICRLRGADTAKLRDVPIIVITSAEDDAVRERAYACGANDFILKPFNANQLLDCVRLHLSSANARADELDARYGAHIEAIVVSDAIGTPEEALAHVDTGLNILKTLKADQLVPQLPAIATRFLPFLKYLNTAYALEIESEIAAIERKAKTTSARGRSN